MSEVASSLVIRWAAPEELRAAAAAITAAIGSTPAYISHGEIQTGLSTDGREWIANLEQRMLSDFADLGPDRQVVVAYDGPDLVCVGVVLKQFDAHARYVVIEDIAVVPTVRSGGVGGRVMAFVEDEARAWGADWAFMESGIRNERAHSFFERHDYQPISKVFAKPL